MFYEKQLAQTRLFGSQVPDYAMSKSAGDYDFTERK